MTAAKQTQAQASPNGTATLAEALVAIQADAPTIALDGVNPHFKSKYPSLAGVMEKVRPVIARNGVAITQLPTTLEGAPALTTRLIHAASEQSIESTMLLLPAKPDPQGQGSALTYARRYMVLAMLGLVGDEDDDANAASSKPGEQAPKATVTNMSGLPDEQVNQLGKGIRAVGLELDRLQLLFGSIGADAPETDSSKDLRAALKLLTPGQADQFQAALNAEADKVGESQ
jgi:hypothetical protein